VDMRLEVVVVPVSDVDRAKQFYKGLGWREDVDVVEEDFRAVQMTPPGSSTSIHFGSGFPGTEPGSAQGMYVAVDDIQAARAELVEHGADVSEVFHDAKGGLGLRWDPALRATGRDPERRSYASYATFRDPDGNGWVLQELTTRLPGRV
jgi:catechol 2,3-dioxygenase-like lactoylglutathione lyase family enzyme